MMMMMMIMTMMMKNWKENNKHNISVLLTLCSLVLSPWSQGFDIQVKNQKR